MIRPATEADLQAILDIYNDAVINTTAVYTYTPHTLDMRRQWFKEHREARASRFRAGRGRRGSRIRHLWKFPSVARLQVQHRTFHFMCIRTSGGATSPPG